MEENHVSRKTKFDTLDVTNGEALVTFHLSTDLENIEKLKDVVFLRYQAHR